MEAQTVFVEIIEQEDKTVLAGACPFLTLRQLCLDERVKFTEIAAALFNNTQSASRAFWVFCNNEQKKINNGKTGYTLSYDRIVRLNEIGISCEVEKTGGVYTTSAWVCNRSLFQGNTKPKKKPSNKDRIATSFS